MKFKACFWCTNDTLISYVIVIHDAKTIVVPIYKKNLPQKKKFTEFFSLKMQSCR